MERVAQVVAVARDVSPPFARYTMPLRPVPAPIRPPWVRFVTHDRGAARRIRVCRAGRRFLDRFHWVRLGSFSPRVVLSLDLPLGNYGQFWVTAPATPP